MYFNDFCQFDSCFWSFFRLNGILRVLERGLHKKK
jgi:hypothetical protein